jgi:hypothetical protein
MRTIVDKTPCDFGEKLSSNTLTRIAGRNVKVVKVRAVDGVLVPRRTCETNQMTVFFGE